MNLSCILLLFCIGQTCGFASSTDPYSATTKTLDRLLNVATYDKRLRPYLQGPPLNVTVDMTIVSIGGINEINMDFSLDMFFRQYWKDPRLAHNLTMPIVLEGKYRNLIWIPDTYFYNVRIAKFHNVPSANSRVALKPNGDVEYSVRITMTASCLMNFRNFPMDTQICNLDIQSYSYDKFNVDYFWKSTDGNKLQVLKKEMPEFELHSTHQEKHTTDYVTGAFTNLTVQFMFHRRIGYSLLQIYAPTFLIVTLSWLSFWVSKDAVPARIALGVTTVLTIVTLMASFRQSVPKVSYVKALDWYLIVSFFFVFGSVLEYVAVVLHADVQNWRKKKNSDEMLRLENIKFEPEKQADRLLRRADELNLTCRHQSVSADPKRVKTFKLPFCLLRETNIIDRTSRVLFPLVYFFFNFVYWLIYLT